MSSDGSREGLEAEIESLRALLDASRRELQRGRSGALLASEELNRRIIEAMPGGIVHVSKDGAIANANPEALRILGLSYDALSERYTRDFDPETIKEDGTPCTQEEYPVTRAIVTGEPQPPMTIGVRRRDGQVYWAVFTAIPVRDPDSGAVTGAVVTFLDITERKRAEEALLRSKGLLRSIVESAPNPVVSADREGVVVFANRTPDYFGAAPVEGRLLWEALPPEVQPRARERHQRVLLTGETEAFEADSPTGRKWMVHAAPRYTGGEVVGVTYAAWEVTKERQLEAQLAVTDRLSSVGLLAAGVAHEINNPLTYLLGNLESLRGNAATLEPAELELRLEAAREGASRIRRVISDLGSYSRVGERAPALVEATELVDAALRMANTQIRYRARVDRDYPAGPALVVDDGRLAQVFLNLIVNAAQAIPEGEPHRNTIRVAVSASEDGRTRIRVADTGVGIATHHLGRVFEPFFTTKSERVGTGLGLFICRSVVHHLGGEITVASRLGEGSTFEVLLPAVLPAGVQPRAPRADQSPPVRAQGRRRILVVDDERAILEVMRLLLREHEVVTAAGGSAALDLLRQERFDLVFCDLIMPEVSGVEVHEELVRRDALQAQRLVFMTGGAFTERTQRFLEGISHPVLRKPFSKADLDRLMLSLEAPTLAEGQALGGLRP